jgi:hypothetical protein
MMIGKQQDKTITIEVSQLCVGIYVYLDIGWLEHSFPLSNFKIKNDSQISAIKQLGLKNIRVSPRRSDCRPLALKAEAASEGLSASKQRNKTINLKKRIQRVADLHLPQQIENVLRLPTPSRLLAEYIF